MRGIDNIFSRFKSKPDWLALTTYVFTDSNGVKYYKYIDDLNIPIVRFTHLQRFINELSNGLSRNEMTLLIDKLDEAYNKQDFSMVGFIITEIKNRRDYLVHEDIMFAMVAALYIREDQNPAVWDEDIEDEKIEQFKLDSKKKGRIYDFFNGAGMSKYLPYFKKLKGDLPQLLDNQKKKTQALMEVFGLEKKSSHSLRTETTN